MARWIAENVSSWAGGKALDMAIGLGNRARELEASIETPEEQAQRAADIDDKYAQRQASRHEDLDKRRQERAESIAQAEQRGMGQSADSARQAESNAEAARQQLAKDIEAAKQLRDDMAQPDPLEKVSSTSAAVTSSAYAFGQFGGGSPEIKAQKKAEDQRKKQLDRLDKIAKNTERLGQEVGRQRIFQMDGAS
jgi:hypothetical protein